MSKAEVITLPQGPRLILETVPDARSVALGFWIPVGARHEAERYTGIAHFTEHLLFKGTARRSARQIVEEIDGVGGNINAFTSREYTAVTCQVLPEHLALAYDVVSDIVFNSCIETEDIDRERKVILEEVRMYEDSPDDLVHDLFNQTAWRKAGLGRPILGTERSLARIRQAQLQQFYKREYRPDRLLISLAGAFDQAEMFELVRSLPQGGRRRARRFRPKARFYTECQRIKKDVEQVHICLGWQGLSWNSPEKYVLHVMATVLGGGMSSRLFQEIREQRGLAYAVYSYVTTFSQEGSLINYAGTSPENLEKVLACFFRETSRLAKKTLTAGELRRVKEQIKGHLVLGLESNASRSHFNALHYLFSGRPVRVADILARIERVTSSQVRSLAAKTFGRRPALVTIGPEDDMRRVEKVLSD